MTETSEASKQELKTDAKSRGLRSLAQTLLVTALVGGATGIYQITQSGDILDLATIATAAASGALIALSAWVQRRLGK